jgi:hypothetical protein
MPASTQATPITAHTASPVMNDPWITPMPWKNHTTPTTSSTTAIVHRIHTRPAYELRGIKRVAWCSVMIVGAIALLSAPAAARRQPHPYPQDRHLRVNDVQVLGTHNSYHVRPDRQLLPEEPADYAHPSLDVQLAQGIRSLEIDVQNGPTFPVYHSIIVDQGSNCATLAVCLKVVERWSRAHPGHVPLLLFVELKQLPFSSNSALEQVIDKFDVANQFTPWDAGALDRLDAVVRHAFGKDLVTPDQVRGRRASLRDAITRSGWPTLGATRGRVIVAFNSDAMRPTYLSGHPTLEGRAMFAIARSAALPYSAIMSVPDPRQSLIRPLLDQNMIVRTQADVDGKEARADDLTRAAAAFASGAQVVATDYPMTDPTIGPYVVTVPGSAVGRCDPVTAPRSCRDRDVENAVGLRTG